jgi:ABC transporter with metal-binding/Fe-S-binding domain ATP-binding protein
MFHFPNAEWTALQAEAMGIPIVQVRVSGLREKELAELENSISILKSVYGIDSLISGAIESNYQRQRLADICERNGLKLITPIWKKSPMRLIEEMLKAGFDIRFVGVSALGLGEEWLGRKLDSKTLKELHQLSGEYGIHLAGEGGEYETFVCESPLFKRRIEITQADKLWSHDSGMLLIKKARLVERNTS